MAEFIHDDIHFHYRDEGDGIPFFFQHGLGADLTQPFSLCRTPAGIRLIAFDARAHERYLGTGESLGKAGAYSIQGAGGDLIDSMTGDFPAVVGLPLRLVAQLLTQAGVSLPVDLEELYAAKPYANWARFSI